MSETGKSWKEHTKTYAKSVLKWWLIFLWKSLKFTAKWIWIFTNRFVYVCVTNPDGYSIGSGKFVARWWRED